MRIVRSDFYINNLIGSVFNAKFYSLVNTYYFFIHMGVSMYLNAWSVESAALHLARITHRARFSTKSILYLAAVVFILFLFLMYYLEYLKTQLRHLVN